MPFPGAGNLHFWNLAVHLNHPGKHENNSLWGPEPRNSDEEVQVWAWDVCWQQRFPWDGAAAHPGGGRREAAGAQEKMNYTSLHPGVRVGLKSLPICLLPSPSPSLSPSPSSPSPLPQRQFSLYSVAQGRRNSNQKCIHLSHSFLTPSSPHGYNPR